jgi:hypothetical protein
MSTLLKLWNESEAAGEFSPLPGGKYRCRLVAGTLMTSKKGTPYYRLLFEVLDGEYAGQRISLPVWLTAAAIPYAKRDLGKIGITSLKQLEEPLVPNRVCDVNLVLRVDDDGNEVNRVRSFTVIGTEAPDVFAPKEKMA